MDAALVLLILIGAVILVALRRPRRDYAAVKGAAPTPTSPSHYVAEFEEVRRRFNIDGLTLTKFELNIARPVILQRFNREPTDIERLREAERQLSSAYTAMDTLIRERMVTLVEIYKQSKFDLGDGNIIDFAGVLCADIVSDIRDSIQPPFSNNEYRTYLLLHAEVVNPHPSQDDRRQERILERRVNELVLKETRCKGEVAGEAFAELCATTQDAVDQWTNVLARKYHQTVSLDDYGNKNERKFMDELNYFIDTVL